MQRDLLLGVEVNPKKHMKFLLLDQHNIFLYNLIDSQFYVLILE